MSISIPFTHTPPHFYAFTHFILHLFCIYISSTRNSNVQFGKLTPRICLCESFSGSWEARRKGNHTVPGSSPLRLPAGCNWPIGSMMASNCTLINTFMFFFYCHHYHLFLIILEKRESPLASWKAQCFSLKVRWNGRQKNVRLVLASYSHSYLTSYKATLCVLPPTDKNLSFSLPVFHSFCSNVAKPVARFPCPPP